MKKWFCIAGLIAGTGMAIASGLGLIKGNKNTTDTCDDGNGNDSTAAAPTAAPTEG